MKFTPHDYQSEAIGFLLDRLLIGGERGAGVFLDPGLGKTAITLEVIRILRRHGMAKRVLIVAPLRVIYLVWPAEVKKWGYPYSISVVHGAASKRRIALARDADLYITSPGNLRWLVEEYKGAFDLVVFDESTMYKSWSAQRSKAARKLIARTRKRIILTGTPSPNGYGDLHSQIFLLDDGNALGKTVTYFREWAMRDVGVGGYANWQVHPAAEAKIRERIAPLVVVMRAEDHLDMPELVMREVYISLPPAVRAAYRQIERALFAELDSGEQLIANSAGAKYAMCRGIANGGAYITPDGHERLTIHVHDEKVNAVREVVDELAGKPAIVAYLYHHDRDRLKRAFPSAPVICGGQPTRELVPVVEKWNRGEVPVLLVQPQALSHGANLQFGGSDLIWCGLIDQLEAYLQLNARLYRQGASRQIRVHHILAEHTVDEAVYDRIQNKSTSQDALLQSLKAYREREQ